MPRLMWSKT